MHPIKTETFEEMIERYKAATATLTSSQLDAVLWVTGSSCCQWSKENIIESLDNDLKRHNHSYQSFVVELEA